MKKAELLTKTANDPVYFVETILKGKLWGKEKEILNSVRDNKITAVRSCHASGKTYTAARAVNWWLFSHRNSIVITTAPTFRQVKEQLWREIRACALARPLYPSKSVLDTSINIDNQWFALGLSTDRPDQFQGFHSPNLLAVIDEASGVSEEIYQAIDGLVPKRILMIGNPLSNEGRFAESFKMDGVSKIQISAFDTPNIIAKDDVIPGLINWDAINKAKSYYGEDSDVYRVRILGEFPLSDSDSLIGVDEVEHAIQRKVKVLPNWEKKMGVDPARFGDDRTVIVVRQMEDVIRKEIFSTLDTMEIAGHVLRVAKEEKVLGNNIMIDEVGIGAGIVDRLREQGWRVTGVNVGVSAKDPERYYNLRTELYVQLKEWLKTGSLTEDDDWYEIANIKYKFNSNGQMMLEKKEDMKKRGLNSPDVADALVMTLAGGRRAYKKASETVSPLAQIL